LFLSSSKFFVKSQKSFFASKGFHFKIPGEKEIFHHPISVASPSGFCLSEYFVNLLSLFPVLSYLLILLETHQVVVGNQHTLCNV
jgi:hypothetical protein